MVYKTFTMGILLALPGMLIASGGSGETDIIPRTINFLIFASIIYYLVADKVKNFFLGRQESIARKLESIQTKLKESKAEKERALHKIEEAKQTAMGIVKTAHKEAELLKEKIARELEHDMASLEKGHNEKMEIEKRKMVRAVVADTIEEVFAEGALPIDSKEFIQIIQKKVA